MKSCEIIMFLRPIYMYFLTHNPDSTFFWAFLGWIGFVLNLKAINNPLTIFMRILLLVNRLGCVLLSYIIFWGARVTEHIVAAIQTFIKGMRSYKEIFLMISLTSSFLCQPITIPFPEGADTVMKLMWVICFNPFFCLLDFFLKS